MAFILLYIAFPPAWSSVALFTSRYFTDDLRSLSICNMPESSFSTVFQTSVFSSTASVQIQVWKRVFRLSWTSGHAMSGMLNLAQSNLIDSQLSMFDCVALLCFFQLRQLRQVRLSLTEESTKTLAHSFMSNRLDYCNGLLYGVNDGLLKIVHNAAARVVTAARKFDHISPVMRELHWFPVGHRSTYQLAMIAYKCLHGLALPYLVDDCVPVTTTAVAGRRHLQSADSQCLVVPRTKTVLGTCNFAVAGPLVWSSCVLLSPANIRSASVSLQTFARRLKTYLFELPWAQLRTVYFALIIIIIYRKSKIHTDNKTKVSYASTWP